jgi:hypothetical protein
VLATAAWLVIAAIAVVFGIAREFLLTPAVGAYPAHVAGTAALVVVIAALAAVYFGVVDHSPAEALLVAVGWPIATILFEFGFGHYVVGHPWSRLLADYDLLAGRVWVVVLLALFLAPLAFGYLRARRRAGPPG